MDPSQTPKKKFLTPMQHNLRHIEHRLVRERAEAAQAQGRSSDALAVPSDAPNHSSTPAAPAESKWAASAAGANAPPMAASGSSTLPASHGPAADAVAPRNQGASGVDVATIIAVLRNNPNDEIMLTRDQVNNIKKAHVCNLLYMTAPVVVGDRTFTAKLYLVVDTGLVYIHNSKLFGYAVGEVSLLFPTIGQQYKEALTCRHEWMDDLTAEFAPPLETEKNTPRFFRQPQETWRLVHPGYARSLKIELGKPQDAALVLLFHCLEKPEKIWTAVYTGIPTFNWNDQKDINKIKKWRGQQIKRITLQAFRFGDEADQEWTQDEHNDMSRRVKRAIDYGVAHGMAVEEVLDRMNWRKLHIDINAVFNHEQKTKTPLAQEECDRSAEGAVAKRKVLHKPRVAFAKTVSAVENRTLACFPKIIELNLGPDNSGFDWSNYIKTDDQPADLPANQDDDAPDDEDDDQDSGDDKPSPPASKAKGKKTAGGGEKSATKTKSAGNSPAKSTKARSKRPATADDDDEEPVAPKSKRCKATPANRAPEHILTAKNAKKTKETQKKAKESQITWDDYEDDAEEEYKPPSAIRSSCQARPTRSSIPHVAGQNSPARGGLSRATRSSTPAIAGQNSPAQAGPSRATRASSTSKKSPAGKAKGTRN